VDFKLANGSGLAASFWPDTKPACLFTAG